MMKNQAIAVCRVSTPEQKLNNSLNRQEANVIKAAKELEVEITRWWSGDISSKDGTNVNRKDLAEMLDFCKTHKSVKYLIVDEPDRFMRSIDEAAYFEVLFKRLGVKVWYASDAQLNTGDLAAKLLKFSKYFSAEGSNVERQTKSINGHVKAINEGRYTFPPKPGYKKGTLPGVHVPNPPIFGALQRSFREVASGMYRPREALKRLNESEFIRAHAEWRMDKFRIYATDPYYSGAVEVDKQVKARNEHGQHKPMLTKEEHNKLIEVFEDSKQTRSARKQYNPEFPFYIIDFILVLASPNQL